MTKEPRVGKLFEVGGHRRKWGRVTEKVARVAPGLSLAIAALVMATARPARADDPEKTVSAERIRSAAEEYDRGRRAFVAGTFDEAAVHFENAYNDAPRAEALRNAVRARRAAKQGARAATLASLAAARYGDDATTMALVKETLGALASQLYEVRVACDPECGVAADGRVVSLSDAAKVTVYVDPGKRDLIVSWSGDRTKRITVDAVAGGHTDLHVTAPVPVAAPPAPSASLDATRRPDDVDHPPRSSKPLPPGVFIAGAALTAVGIAATIVSGLDAQSNPGKDAVLRDCVGQGESCPTYQRGKSAELRTNVLLGATLGVGIITGVIGVFFTRWRSAPSSVAGASGVGLFMTPYVGPREAGLSGRF